MFAVADDGGGPALVLGLELADFVAGLERGVGFRGLQQTLWRHRYGYGCTEGYGRGLAWLGTGRKSRESSLYGESVEVEYAEVCGELKIVRHPGPRTRGIIGDRSAVIHLEYLLSVVSDTLVIT